MLRRRRLFQTNPMSSDQIAILVRANQLMAGGKPLEAGPLFAQVADAMKSSNHPRRAANLYTRAAHAFADGNDGQAALKYARAALILFTQAKMARRAIEFYTNITRKLSTKGMKAAADALQSEYGAQIEALPVGPNTGNRPAHGQLPTACPKCGAPVHGDEVTWVDSSTIECEYCGASIRSE
jgi:hypothetical protein